METHQAPGIEKFLKCRNWAIVGTGPSVKNQVVEADVIIAVNSAINLLRPDIWFSLDPSPDVYKILEKPVKGVHYVVAFPPHKPSPDFVERYERCSARKMPICQTLHQNGNKRRPAWWFRRWACLPGLSEQVGKINTGNSAYGALGLIYQYKMILEQFGPLEQPWTVTLYGVDGTNEPRVTGGRPNNLSHLPMLFGTAIQQLNRRNIMVYNASPVSTITCFPPPPKGGLNHAKP